MVKKVVRWILLIVGLVLVVYSGINLYKIFSDYKSSDDLYDKLEHEYIAERKNTENNTQEKQWYDDISVDFASLKQQNPDVVGWIYFENEDISYPVMYSGDED